MPWPMGSDLRVRRSAVDVDQRLGIDEETRLVRSSFHSNLAFSVGEFREFPGHELLEWADPVVLERDQACAAQLRPP
jgi:hypothetical protein